MSTATIVLPILAFLVTAIALGMLAVSTGTDTFSEGIVLGLVAGIGVATMVTLVTAAYDPISPKPVTWFLVTGGYHLVGILIASAIIGVWQ
jgi:Na+/H+ antiporter NhaA